MATTKTKRTNAKPQPKSKPSKPARAEKAKPAETKLSALDAAVEVLSKADAPMNCQELIGAMAERSLWASPGGKTPHNTLYAAILREIGTKGKESRFKKAERGQFELSK